MRCRHYKTWLIVGAHAEWCYQCGAWRGMTKTEPNGCHPRTNWVRPTGPDGENPWKKMKDLKSK